MLGKQGRGHCRWREEHVWKPESLAQLENSKLGLPCGLRVKNLPAMQETQEVQVQSLGGEDSLEEGMATHSSILAWRVPWTEEPGVLQSMWLQRVGRDLVTQQQQQISQ